MRRGRKQDIVLRDEPERRHHAVPQLLIAEFRPVGLHPGGGGGTFTGRDEGVSAAEA